MASSRMLRRVALVRTDVSEELSPSFIRVTRIGELRTTLDVISNRRKLRRSAKIVFVQPVWTRYKAFLQVFSSIYNSGP
jgi:hypothetical protein